MMNPRPMATPIALTPVHARISPFSAAVASFAAAPASAAIQAVNDVAIAANNSVRPRACAG